MSSRVRDMTDEELRADAERVQARLGSKHGRTALEALEDAEAIVREMKRRQQECAKCGGPIDEHIKAMSAGMRARLGQPPKMPKLCTKCVWLALTTDEPSDS